MHSKLSQEGIIDTAELKKSAFFPSPKRLKEGPVAIIECVEEIPCNPCESICPEEAIKVGEPITNLPRFSSDKCTGCGLCIAQCPGLAIFVVDLTYSENQAMVELPYEFLPLPAVGEEVEAVNREGQAVSSGIIKRIQNPQKFNRTAVISLAVPKNLAMEVRSIKIADERRAISGKRLKKRTKLLTPHPSPLTQIVCRCEETGENQIKEAIEHGMSSLKAIKNWTRTGMGLCQGRICKNLVAQLISQNTDLCLEEIEPPRIRPPVRPIDLMSLAEGKEDD